MKPLPPPRHGCLRRLLATLLLTATAASAAPMLNWSATVDTGAAVADRAKAVGVMTTGDVIAVSQIGAGTAAQIRVQRLAGGTGTAMWTRDVGTAGMADDAAAIAIVPASGAAYVAARAATAASGLDWLVFKVKGTDGTLDWASNFTYSIAGNDEPRAIALTSDGNLAVAGMETNPTSGQGRLRVTKLNATTGTQMWNYTSPTDDTDAFCVGSDATGNVIAAGRIGLDAYTVSLSSAGLVNWTQTYNGAGNGNDAWNAITVFPNGDMAVAGYVTGSSGGQNFAVARYAAAGGSPAWVREINGTANGSDMAFDATNDGTDVVAAGLLRDTTHGQTACVAKLAGASGTLTWSNSVNGTNAVLEATNAFFAVRMLGTEIVAAGTQADATHQANILISRFSAAGVLQESTVFDGTGHNDMLLSKSLLATASTSTFVVGGDSENTTAISNGALFSYAHGAVDHWRLVTLGSTTNTGNAADAADPNHNGISNLLEYALNGDPLGTTTGTGILPKVSRSGTNHLQLAFARYLDRTDLSLTVQASDTLNGTWTDLAQSVNGAAFTLLSGAATVTESGTGNSRSVTASDLYLITDPAHRHRFMRLKATLP
ncbi:MAG: hypothetical protein NTW21_11595 [Verrucomicrobia bacterium]|nr:hypothetical protein [Verrucomicrobiota bacterium]